MQGSNMKISAHFGLQIFDLSKASVVVIFRHSEYITLARII